MARFTRRDWLVKSCYLWRNQWLPGGWLVRFEGAESRAEEKKGDIRPQVQDIGAMASSSLWQRFQQYLVRYEDVGFSIDISRMNFPDDFFERTRALSAKALLAMRDLEEGGI